MKNFIKILSVLFGLYSSAAYAQNVGLLQPGGVLGNATGSLAPPQDFLLSSFLDQNFCTTQNDFLQRGASAWVCVANLVATTNSANALTAGQNGSTNPAFNVDASTASSVTGINIKSAASGGGALLSATSSATNENLIINAKAAGGIQIGSTSTGGVQLASAGGGVAVNGASIGGNAFAVNGNSSFGGVVAINSNSAIALVVGPNGATNPALVVNASASTEVTGVSVTGHASGGSANIASISSATNENLNIDAKGSGVIGLGTNSTGGVQLGQGGGGATVFNSFTATGLVTFADMATAAVSTTAQYLSGAASTLVPASVIYTSETTTTFGATTTFDFSTFINTAVTLTGNITTQTLSNVASGKAGQIRFIQDGTGSRTTVWNSIFKFTGGVTPVLSTAPSSIDVLFYSCVSATLCYASLSMNMK